MLRETQLASSRARNEPGSLWGCAQPPTAREAEPRGEGIRGSRDTKGDVSPLTLSVQCVPSQDSSQASLAPLPSGQDRVKGMALPPGWDEVLSERLPPGPGGNRAAWAPAGCPANEPRRELVRPHKAGHRAACRRQPGLLGCLPLDPATCLLRPKNTQDLSRQGSLAPPCSRGLCLSSQGPDLRPLHEDPLLTVSGPHDPDGKVKGSG